MMEQASKYGEFLMDNQTVVSGVRVGQYTGKNFLNYLPRLARSSATAPNTGDIILCSNGRLMCGVVRDFMPQGIGMQQYERLAKLSGRVLQYITNLNMLMCRGVNNLSVAEIKTAQSELERQLRELEKTMSTNKSGISCTELKNFLASRSRGLNRTYFVSEEDDILTIRWHTELCRRYTGPMTACFNNGILDTARAQNSPDYTTYLKGIRASLGGGIEPHGGTASDFFYHISDCFELSKCNTLFYSQTLRIKFSFPLSTQVVTELLEKCKFIGVS